MRIKRFIEFIPEAYLSGGRQPLYHFTSRLNSILDSNTLKISKPTRSSHGNLKSISLTRNIDYSDTTNQYCIELDSDRLLKNGIKSFPVDEWAWTREGKPNIDAISSYNMGKSNFDEVKKGRRGTKHGLDLPKEFILETEFEERIYKDITNLGKYISSIYVRENQLSGSLDRLKNYLVEYPNIKIYTFVKFPRIKVDITDRIKSGEKVLLNP